MQLRLLKMEIFLTFSKGFGVFKAHFLIKFFLSQTTILGWLTFLLESLITTLTVLLLWISFFLLALVIVLQEAFPPLGNYDHVAVSVSIEFPSNWKRDTPFHCTGDEIEMVFVIIWEMVYGRISSNLLLLLMLQNFLNGIRLEIMYMPLIVNIRSSLIHFHDFQLLVLLP